ncbi:2-oxoglutarate dehydrogenase E1 subunit family protein, partial [Streptomyces botrytidirepellens]
MSPQSPNTSSVSTDEQDGQGSSPAAAFGPNEWLVDEIYQQYLQDPNSVDRAWWDFFADYKPGQDTGSAVATPPQGVTGGAAPAPAAKAPAPAKPADGVPAAKPADAKPAAAQPTAAA